MNEKAKSKWWKPLISIPIVLITDLVIFLIASLLDSQGSGNTELGHPFPVFTLISVLIILAITAITLILSITKSFSILFKKKDGSKENDAKTEKPVWKYFIPLIIQVLISLIALIISGSIEINSFYSNPNHIGFAIPAATILLSFILISAAAFTLVITLIIVKRKKRLM